MKMYWIYFIFIKDGGGEVDVHQLKDENSQLRREKIKLE